MLLLIYAKNLFGKIIFICIFFIFPLIYSFIIYYYYLLYRIRKEREGDREAILAALICRTFHDHVMVFVQTKKQAHRLHILLGLLGIKVNY